MPCRSLFLGLAGIVLLAGARGQATAGPPPWGTPGGPTSQLAAASSGPVDPADFSSAVDNPWLPLVPGTILTYRGTKDNRSAVRIMSVTRKTAVIDGVTCVVVDDQVSLAGTLSERALGYYAQDREGNVWYFGEDSDELDAQGHVTKSEGWRAGVDGALPSFIMEVTPTVGHAFVHKYSLDHFKVLSLSESVEVPYGSFEGTLLTEEWNDLERDVLTHKYYARGLGEIRDVAVEGDREEFDLVKVGR